jgi:hypothetical protein
MTAPRLICRKGEPGDLRNGLKAARGPHLPNSHRRPVMRPRRRPMTLNFGNFHSDLRRYLRTSQYAPNPIASIGSPAPAMGPGAPRHDLALGPLQTGVSFAVAIGTGNATAASKDANATTDETRPIAFISRPSVRKFTRAPQSLKPKLQHKSNSTQAPFRHR